MWSRCVGSHGNLTYVIGRVDVAYLFSVDLGVSVVISSICRTGRAWVVGIVTDRRYMLLPYLVPAMT